MAGAFAGAEAREGNCGPLPGAARPSCPWDADVLAGTPTDADFKGPSGRDHCPTIQRRWPRAAIVLLAQGFLNQEEVDSGIIVSRGPELLFWHLTFQEYLAARTIGGLRDTVQQSLLLDRAQLYRPEWREVVLLPSGHSAGEAGSREGGRPISGGAGSRWERSTSGKESPMRWPARGNAQRPSATSLSAG